MTEQDIGPIDYLTLEFPKAKLTGEGLAALIDLVDRGIIRILDLRFIKREDDGSFSALAVIRLRRGRHAGPRHLRGRGVRPPG